MPTFQDFFRHDILLDSSPSVATKYTIPCLLVDHADVPVDKRLREMTPATWATRCTSSTEQYNWFDHFYNQPYPLNPANSRDNIAGYVGRWVSAATAAYRVFPNAEDDATVWAALTSTGQFNIDDGTNDEDVTPDFTGDTDMDDVAASITTALAGGTNFTGYVCSVDAYNRLIITGSATGASAPSFTIGSPAAGTDLSGAAYLGTATSFLQAGLDAETLGAAVTAIRAKSTVPTVFFERGATDVQALAWVTAMDAIDGVFAVAVSSDTEHEDSEATTTLAYQADALELGKCHIIYSRQNDYPDAIYYGEILPRPAGSCDYALTPCSIASGYTASPSGMELDGVTPDEVSDAAVEALDAVNCDFVTTPFTNTTHLARGLCPNGDEVRIVLGQMFIEYNSSLEGYQFMVANEVNTFSDIFLMEIKGIAEKWLDLAVARKMIEPGYQLNMPAASDFTAAQKASHYMSLPNVASAGIQFAVNQVFMSSIWSAQ